MVRFLVHWLFNSVALLIVAHVIPGISIDNWLAALFAAFVLGLLNVFIKPLFVLITLPLNIMTLGLFTLVINGGMLYLSAMLVRGFAIGGFWSAFWGALLFSILSFIMSSLFLPRGGGFFFGVQPPNRARGRRENAIDAEIVEDREHDRRRLH